MLPRNTVGSIYVPVEGCMWGGPAVHGPPSYLLPAGACYLHFALTRWMAPQATKKYDYVISCEHCGP